MDVTLNMLFKSSANKTVQIKLCCVSKQEWPWMELWIFMPIYEYGKALGWSSWPSEKTLKRLLKNSAKAYNTMYTVSCTCGTQNRNQKKTVDQVTVIYVVNILNK